MYMTANAKSPKRVMEKNTSPTKFQISIQFHLAHTMKQAIGVGKYTFCVKMF